MILNKDILYEEYVDWGKHYGNRNNQDLRFGQYIWNKFNDDMKELFPDPYLEDDGFYVENFKKAYELINNKLINNE